MEFNQIIVRKLHSLFVEHGLKISEQSMNVVRYTSDELTISLVHNSVESSNMLWIGRKDSADVEIDNQVIREYFNSELKLSNLPKQTFVNNVFQFFVSDGEKLLEGNERALTNLEKFNEKRSQKYTASVVEKQNLDAANKAWKDGNYLEVIKYLEKINTDSLSKSFKQKYQIAKKKLGK